VAEDEADYRADVLYVNLETAVQLMWAGSSQSNDDPCFVFMQVVHARPQTTLGMPSISVRVFAKSVKDDTVAPAMTLQRKHVLYDSTDYTLDRVIFSLQIRNAGYTMATYNKVLVGLCSSARPDEIRMLVFDMLMDYVFTFELAGCLQCCVPATLARPNTIHAHLDHALRILYIFSDKVVYNTTLHENVLHKQQRGYTPTSLGGGMPLPAFFQQPGRRIVQVAPASQVPFVLYMPMSKPNDHAEFSAHYARHWQSFYITTADDDRNKSAAMGMLHVAFQSKQVMTSTPVESDLRYTSDITSDPLEMEYTELFENKDILQALRQQIAQRHFRGVDIDKHGAFMQMELHGFSVMNDLKRMEFNESWDAATTSVHVLVSHVQRQSDVLSQQNDMLHDQILSLVQVVLPAFAGSMPTNTPAAATVTVKLLAVVAHQQRDTPHTVLYSIVPHHVSADAPNNIMAKSVVAVMVQRGNTHTVQTYTFSCQLCGAGLYNAATLSCGCHPGTTPVCLPCSTDCVASSFIVNPSHEQCHTGRAAAETDTGAQSYQRHNLVCMPCTGTFFCGNGAAVDAIEPCPASRPYTLDVRSTGDSTCLCPVGFASRASIAFNYTADESPFHNTGFSRQMQQFPPTNGSVQPCDACHDTQICTPLYTHSSHNVQCPAHTVSKTQYIRKGGHRPVPWSNTLPDNDKHVQYHNVYQGCFCVDGYYRVQHTSHSYLLDSVDFIYQYTWDNAVLDELSRAGNTMVHVHVERCRQCQPGWACVNSSQRECVPSTSSAVLGSTTCSCKPGYVRNQEFLHSSGIGEPGARHGQECTSCPPHSVCPGGDRQALACVTPRRVQNLVPDHCPCASGYVVSATTWHCEPCPRNFYCPGFPNMTGIDPWHTMYARRCPSGATSPAGSISLTNCSCGGGYFLPAPQADKETHCVACGAGYYCAASVAGSRAACPQHTTTRAGLVTAASRSDCLCKDPAMQKTYLHNKCVCRPGWLQTRSVRA